MARPDKDAGGCSLFFQEEFGKFYAICKETQSATELRIVRKKDGIQAIMPKAYLSARLILKEHFPAWMT